MQKWGCLQTGITWNHYCDEWMQGKFDLQDIKRLGKWQKKATMLNCQDYTETQLREWLQGKGRFASSDRTDLTDPDLKTSWKPAARCCKPLFKHVDAIHWPYMLRYLRTSIPSLPRFVLVLDRALEQACKSSAQISGDKNQDRDGRPRFRFYPPIRRFLRNISNSLSAISEGWVSGDFKGSR